eukprot:12891975-Prorocentrum_lima.AAC.1
MDVDTGTTQKATLAGAQRDTELATRRKASPTPKQMEPMAVKAKPTATKGPPPEVRAHVPLYTTGAEVVTPVATKPKTTA